MSRIEISAMAVAPENLPQNSSVYTHVAHITNPNMHQWFQNFISIRYLIEITSTCPVGTVLTQPAGGAICSSIVLSVEFSRVINVDYKQRLAS
jgi:hypothetical protein